MLFQHANAQHHKHSLMLWCEAGYSAFFTQWEGLKNMGNIGSGIGFGYNALFWNHFIVAVGVEYVSLNSSTRPTNLVFYKDLIDTEEDEYVMRYSLQKFVQLDRTHNVFVPIYVGFQTAQRKTNFFFQAGGKIGYMFSANYNTKMTSYTTVGIYDRFFDHFENMPNHFFDTKKYSKREELNLNRLQAVVSLELGVELASIFPKNAMRISFFADYGVLNRQSSEMRQMQNELVAFEQIPNLIHVNSLYETNLKRSANTTSFFTGVKITLLFDVTRSSNCAPKRKK
ncbi:MAG: hypothetical protein FWC34_11955 [Bacteroidetes bacterium]|nr:hypothetical protein [Bacteroidota bacterium]